jgi:tRNA(Ile)-lysidine synthase
VRYAFFDEVAERETRPVVIALAHNQDDQAETVLMRILRGTGTDGLAGIPVKRDSAAGFPVVRPLLDTPRWAIEDWLARGGIAYRQDASNLERDAFRNRVRLDALPALEASAREGAGACAKQGLLRLARNAAEDRAFFDAVTDRVLLDCEKAGGGAQDGSVLVIPITALAGLHAAVGHRVMVKAFARLGLGRDIAGVHLAAADDLLRKAAHPRETGGATGKRVEFPQDYTFGIERDEKGVLCAVFRAPTARRADWKPRRKQVELDEPL